MRILKKNTSTFWRVTDIKYKELETEDDILTGEVGVETYRLERVQLSCYPSNGVVRFEQFGEVGMFDMVALSTNIELEIGDRLYVRKPTKETLDLYDYDVSNNYESLNVNLYGLKKRV